MQALRSHFAAGVAVLGAGAIALTPVQPITAPAALSPAATQAIGVSLAAAIDPITPIITTIQTTITNTTTLVADWLATPFPILAQVVNNWIYYLTELPNVGAIVSQVISNVGNAFRAPFDPGTISDGTAGKPAGLANGDNISTVPWGFISTAPLPIPNIDLTQRAVYDLLPTLEPDFVDANIPLLNFLNTPISGQLFGLLGPVVAPFVALGNSISSAITAVQASDITGAINSLINIPTSMINAALNGTTLDLTALLAPSIPSVDRIGFAVGGLLTTFTSPTGVTVPGTQVGGVGFNALSLDADVQILPAPIPPVRVSDPGIGIGLIGSLVSLTRSIAGAINQVPTSPGAAVTTAARRAPVAAKSAKPAGPARAAAAARHAR